VVILQKYGGIPLNTWQLSYNSRPALSGPSAGFFLLLGNLPAVQKPMYQIEFN
jgi:hypothetical protein